MRKTYKTVTSFDGYPLEVCLWLPKEADFEKLCLFINSSGPHTCINTFSWQGNPVDYQNLFAEQFTKNNIAYCTYSTRGITMAGESPLYYNYCQEAYKQYLPSVSVRDIEMILQALKRELKWKKTLLLGQSEGTILAPIVALSEVANISALLLTGYCHENLKDNLHWQLNGNAEYTAWSHLLDTAKKGYISKEDFAQASPEIKNALFGPAAFEEIDANKDGVINLEDARPRSLPHLENMLRAIEENDDGWLRNNHGVLLTSGWFKEHFALPATKDVLPKLSIPVFIFQGEADSMTPAHYIPMVKERFAAEGKANLHAEIFKGHSHDLNYFEFVIHNKISKGLQSIFQTAASL